MSIIIWREYIIYIYSQYMYNTVRVCYINSTSANSAKTDSRCRALEAIVFHAQLPQGLASNVHRWETWKTYGPICKKKLHITCETCELTISYIFFCQRLSICCGMSRWKPFKFCCSPHCVAMPSWKVHSRALRRNRTLSPSKDFSSNLKGQSKTRSTEPGQYIVILFLLQGQYCALPSVEVRNYPKKSLPK